MNLFLVSGYHLKESFCNRTEELNSLSVSIENERNATLASPRRMGKAGLILRLFENDEELK